MRVGSSENEVSVSEACENLPFHMVDILAIEGPIFNVVVRFLQPGVAKRRKGHPLISFRESKWRSEVVFCFCFVSGAAGNFPPLSPIKRFKGPIQGIQINKKNDKCLKAWRRVQTWTYNLYIRIVFGLRSFALPVAERLLPSRPSSWAFAFPSIEWYFILSSSFFHRSLMVVQTLSKNLLYLWVSQNASCHLTTRLNLRFLEVLCRTAVRPVVKLLLWLIGNAPNQMTHPVWLANVGCHNASCVCAL